VDAKDLKKTISYRQGLDSDSSTSIIPPEMGCQSPEVEVTSWMKIWDVTLTKDREGTKSMLALLFEITKPAFGSKPCPDCDIEELDSSLFHHLMETHPHDHVATCAR